MIQKILFLLLFSFTALLADTQEEFFIEEEVSSGGLNFGIGAGVMLLSDADIVDTTIDNGRVRVTTEEKEKLGFWLTSSWVNNSWPSEDIQIGPFVGLQFAGDKDFLNSLAVGLNLSFMKVKYGLPLDFQVGWAWTKTTQLADGYKDNELLPTGSTQVITKDIVTDGFVFITSYKF